MKTFAERSPLVPSRAVAMPLPNALAHKAQLVQALFRAGIQPRLQTGVAHASLEREAEGMAEEVASLSTAPTRMQRFAGGRSAESALGLAGGGQPLEPAVRGDMERSFGQDFSGVRVHTGQAAQQSAKALGAHAYTIGRDIAFGAGQYAPHSQAGKRLLSHELAHVVQQGAAGAPSLQLKAQATRFRGEPKLDDISEGRAELKLGDKEEAVILIGTAFSELGRYPPNLIKEEFDGALSLDVALYQIGKGLDGKVPAGVMEQQTFNKLDEDFSSAAKFGVERNVLSGQKAPNVLNQTRSLDSKSQEMSARAVSTEPPVNRATGALPTFRPDIPSVSNYAARLHKIVEDEIKAQWKYIAKGKAAARTKPGALYDASAINPIAKEAEVAVRATFGEYMQQGGKASAPPLQLGVTVKDAWQEKERQLSVGKSEEDEAVDWRVQKILDGDKAVQALDKQHGAIQTRPAEWAIVQPIKNSLMAKHRTKLLETHKAWPGFAEAGVVYVQLFKGATGDAQRRERWDFFQTFIHEYIHTLEHREHIKYRNGLHERKGGFTLREGTTDYFTKIVWNSLAIDNAMRARVEQDVHDASNPFAIQRLATYHESENAERLAGVVGIRNVAAAYFLGKVELIGKKP